MYNIYKAKNAEYFFVQFTLCSWLSAFTFMAILIAMLQYVDVHVISIIDFTQEKRKQTQKHMAHRRHDLYCF